MVELTQRAIALLSFNATFSQMSFEKMLRCAIPTE
jgi:hypothetical protein